MGAAPSNFPLAGEMSRALASTTVTPAKAGVQVRCNKLVVC